MTVFLITVIRIFHELAAVLWVGSMLFFVTAVQPAVLKLATREEQQLALAAVGSQLREISQVSSAVLLFTGAVLTFDRLSQPHVRRLYAVVLAIKVALSVAMMVVAAGLGQRQRRLTLPRWLSAPYVVMVCGLVVCALAVVLQVIFDVSYGAVS